MVTVECYSGYRVNERPITFTLSECDYTRSFRVREVLDQWFGETADYFKVEADDDNIYLLKYDGRQDAWDLIFYQNPRRLKAVRPTELEATPPLVLRETGTQGSIPIH
jgi:hypothetical protein